MGHTVYGGDNSLTLSQRIQASNNTGVDCHVALHSNAGGGTGPEVWYYSTSNNGKRLAQNILAEIEDVSGCPKSRGVKGSTDYAELKQTSAPAVIVEVAFHDNASDVNWIIGHMNEIGQAIANGINAF
jgi:N-acetylmuramoyl-L-alanine amidase